MDLLERGAAYVGVEVNWLRNLFCPAITHIHFDKEAISIARPGDVVIISVTRPIKAEQRKAIASYLEQVQKTAPGVRFVVLEPPLTAEVRAGRSEHFVCSGYQPVSNGKPMPPPPAPPEEGKPRSRMGHKESERDG